MNLQLSDTRASIDDPILFAFDGPAGRILGRGAPRLLPPGDGSTRAARAAKALADAKPGAMIGGALPFDLGADDCLWLTGPATGAVGRAAAPLVLDRPRITPLPSAGDYASSVARALQIMEAEAADAQGLRKIVLSRMLDVTCAAAIPVEALMARLGSDPAATAFRVTLPGQPHDVWGASLCGATPELLLSKNGAQIVSHPLAGSAPRSMDGAADQAAAQGLAASEKDQREHALVVEYIMDVLNPFCRDLSAPDGTTTTSTASMWHLGTRICGTLRDDTTPSIELASALHPTPAICGVPVSRAKTLIQGLEAAPRDFYAGAVGYSAANGDGAWYVAIRCARITGPSARLYAGAGIVPGSDPMAEAAETGAKFGALLAALGLPADAGMQGVTYRKEN